MKYLGIFTACVVYAAFSAPVLADGNVDVHAGISRTCAVGYCTSTTFSYGAGTGYDFDINSNVFVGGQVAINSIQGDVNYAAVARLGAKTGAESVYVLGGYAAQELGSGLGSAGGFRLGSGYEHMFSKSIFSKIEYNYSHYSKFGYTINQSSLYIGVGTRF
jgi:hypothetical protein